MLVPAGYATVVAGLPTMNVRFDVGGIQLFPLSSLEEMQAGYSKTPNGKSLLTTDGGSWRANWIVIGHETCCGDPIFLDVGDPRLPVFTAMHGEGSWSPQQIAISIEAFAGCFQEFALVAKLRSSPVEVQQHPLGDAEREAFLAHVVQINEGLITSDFWELQVST